MVVETWGLGTAPKLSWGGVKGQQELLVFQHPVLLAKKESWCISGVEVFSVRLWSGPCIRSCKCVFPKLPTHENLGSPYMHFGTVNPLDQTCGIKLPFNGPMQSRLLPQLVHRGVPGWAPSLVWPPCSALGAVAKAAAPESLALLSEFQVLFTCTSGMWLRLSPAR